MTPADHEAAALLGMLQRRHGPLRLAELVVSSPAAERLMQDGPSGSPHDTLKSLRMLIEMSEPDDKTMTLNTTKRLEQ
jgi:hypothetical protein